MIISYIIIIIIFIFMQGINNNSRTRLRHRIMQHLVYGDKYFVVRIN